MNRCVFLGPTLSHEDAAQVLSDTVWLPPAAQGDVFHAAREGAEVIGIVDGYFQGAPSVWHKEILWALERGAQVFGAASMGALRAAELHPFGMVGCGRIFEDFRDGVLIDDDEVAVVHGPDELDYRTVTIPLVNMRATFAAACNAGVISNNVNHQLVNIAVGMPYWQRSYERVFDLAREQHGTLIETIVDWTRDHSIDQKREDAIAMLQVMRQSTGPQQLADFAFVATSNWDDFVSSTSNEIAGAPAEQQFSVLDEVRLLPGIYQQLSRQLEETPNGAASVLDLLESDLRQGLHSRATEKERALTGHMDQAPRFADVDVPPDEVLAWYFEDVCGVRVPVDSEAYAKELGLANEQALLRLLLHELLFVTNN